MESGDEEPGGSSRGYHVSVIRYCRQTGLTRRRIAEAVRFVLRAEGVRSCWLEIAVFDDRQMRALNRRWLGRTGLTDVISFDLSDSLDGDTSHLAGQISVCATVAARRARKAGIRPDAELMLYIVHGLLHLLGYDDLADRDAERMHRREDELLSLLGYGPVYSMGTRQSRSGRQSAGAADGQCTEGDASGMSGRASTGRPRMRRQEGGERNGPKRRLKRRSR